MVLVFTRLEGEEVVIGNPRAPYGTIKVTSIKGSKVRLRFDFPDSIPINRTEYLESRTNQPYSGREDEK